MSKRRVTYYYDGTSSSDPPLTLSERTTLVGDIGSYTYGLGHPMKPHRIRVTHDLVSAYGMLDKMQVLVRPHARSYFPVHSRVFAMQRPKRASPESMTAFHTDEYIHFLNRVTPETVEELTYHGTRCK